MWVKVWAGCCDARPLLLARFYVCMKIQTRPAPPRSKPIRFCSTLPGHPLYLFRSTLPGHPLYLFREHSQGARCTCSVKFQHSQGTRCTCKFQHSQGTRCTCSVNALDHLEQQTHRLGLGFGADETSVFSKRLPALCHADGTRRTSECYAEPVLTLPAGTEQHTEWVGIWRLKTPEGIIRNSSNTTAMEVRPDGGQQQQVVRPNSLVVYRWRLLSHQQTSNLPLLGGLYVSRGEKWA